MESYPVIEPRGYASPLRLHQPTLRLPVCIYCLQALHVAVGANSRPHTFVAGILTELPVQPTFYMMFPPLSGCFIFIIHCIRIYNTNTDYFFPVWSFTQVMSWVDSVGSILSGVHFAVMLFQACRFYVFFIFRYFPPQRQQLYLNWTMLIFMTIIATVWILNVHWKAICWMFWASACGAMGNHGPFRR